MELFDKVEAIAKKIRLKKHKEYDGCGERSEFYSLYNEIVKVLTKNDDGKIDTFYELDDVMSEANFYYRPIEGYIAGMTMKEAGKDCHRGFMEYMLQVDNRLDDANLRTKKQELYNEVVEALGEERGLLTEYIDGYTKYTDVEAFCIRDFFEQGYEDNPADNRDSA